MMNWKRFNVVIPAVLFLILGLFSVSSAKEVTVAIPEALEGLEISGLGYLDYSSGEKGLPNDDSESYNEFRVTRGYLTVEKEIIPWLGARVTMDVHQDDDGNYVERMKYYYAWLKPADLGFLTGMKSEIGMGHMPWLDFEEHINPYRSLGTMAIERAGVFNSSDAGISIKGNFGGKIQDAGDVIGNTHYAGRYGTWHVGVYNGPGYHATEENNNKVLEYRATLRPLPDAIPGFQLSYFGLYGEGNNEFESTGDYPDYMVNLGMLSYQNPTVIFTAQYFTTKGNSKGTWVDASGDALETAGYSLFGTVKLPVLDKKLAVFGRFDHFDPDDDDKIADDTAYSMYTAGISYTLYKQNMLSLAYETTDYEKNSNGKGNVPVPGTDLGDDQKFQAVLQVAF